MDERNVKKKSNNNEKFIPALADIWVQFNQKWLCFKLIADMDQLAFKQIRCWTHLRRWTVGVGGGGGGGGGGSPSSGKWIIAEAWLCHTGQ